MHNNYYLLKIILKTVFTIFTLLSFYYISINSNIIVNNSKDNIHCEMG